MKSVSAVVLLLACSSALCLARAHWIQDCFPSVKVKQPKKCGENIPVHQRCDSFRAAAGEFPFLAALAIKYNDISKADGSGAIIFDQDILTSIKCVRNKSGEIMYNELKVFVGSLYQNKYGEQVEVKKISA